MNEKILKVNKTIKKRALVPYLGSFLHALITYIGAPIYAFLLVAGAVATKSIPGLLFILFILGIILYFMFVIPHFLPGIRLFRDMRLKSFVTCEIQHQNSIINRYQYLFKKNRHGVIKLEQEVFLEVWSRAENDNQLILSSPRYHGMIPGESYTVIYGKNSKVLISILSEKGEELWDIPFDNWLAKKDKTLPIQNMKNTRSRSSETIKNRALITCFSSFFQAIMTYILAPVFVFIFLIGTNGYSSIPWIYSILFILGVGGYFIYVIPRFQPGVRLLHDIIFDSFITCEIKHENSIINHYQYFPRKEKRRGKTKPEQETFLTVYCRKEDNTQLVLSSARYHGMMPGETYTVVYGKYSKVLISIISEGNEELWDIPFDRWYAKRDKVFPALNRDKKRSKRKSR